MQPLDDRIESNGQDGNGILSGYKYHIFISYRRAGEAGEWVHNHFFPVLKGRLESMLPEEPKIFIDENIEKGSKWPEKLAQALHQSRCMIAVWSPGYFRSTWCVAEWETLLARERTIREQARKRE